MRYKSEALLALVSIAVALALCELGLRRSGWGTGTPSLEQAGAAAGQPLDPAAARRYAEALPAAPGTGRQWFLETPAPLPNRSAASVQMRDRFRDFQRRGIFAPQAEYVWNAYYVEAERCNPNGRLRGFPPTVLAFRPPTITEHPRYRFPANTTSVAGLVTNQAGFRGRPIEIAKPARTIRIAFLGASTTVDYHYFAFSYPEFVEHWLNRWAEANHVAVRFEALNAGREAIGSKDIAAIVRGEVLPLDPDLAVYYEGANQFLVNDGLISPAIPRRSQLDPHDTPVESRIPAPLCKHLALARLADAALNGFQTAGEPRKPAYRIMWPAGVDESDPAPDNPRLPMQLPEVIADLDSIRNTLATTGAQLAVCSFQWLAAQGMELSLRRNEEVYRQLNTVLWPLRYGDIRRMADFQNRVFRNYARVHGLPFLDVAGALPQAPSLFIDAIHLTEAGSRLKAWIVFQQLLPVVEARIRSGAWPRAASRQLPPPPLDRSLEMRLACEAPSGPFRKVEGAVALDGLAAEAGVPAIQAGPPAKVATGPQRWSFAARAALRIPASAGGLLYVHVRGRVLCGQIGIGALDRVTRDYQIEIQVPASEQVTDTYVPLRAPDRVGHLILRNTRDGNLPSEMLVDNIELLQAVERR